MLSFLRSKSSDIPVDKIVNGTNELSLHTNNNNSAAQMSDAPTTASHQQCSEDLLKSLGYQNANDLRETIYGECFCAQWSQQRSCTFIADAFYVFLDILRTIRDPEKPSTLEDLHVVYEEGIFIQAPTSDNVQVVSGDWMYSISLTSSHRPQLTHLD